MNNIGIMQGRLTSPIGGRIQCFPKDDWQKEFPLAEHLGFDCIEWIYEIYGEKENPLFSQEGVLKIRQLSSQYNVGVFSICADYFMEKPFIRVSQEEVEHNISILESLMKIGRQIGVNRIVIPFVDNSSINTIEEFDKVVTILKRCLKMAEDNKIEIHLETSLNPILFSDLLWLLPHPLLKVNYDSGNSASLGYSPEEEFNLYGDRIGSFHVKDRLFGNGTVPLGTGDTDFASLSECINKIDYKGDFILQAARGEEGDEAPWSEKNLDFVLTNFYSNRLK
jgi:hexulose-6-phosphate isomerase